MSLAKNLIQSDVNSGDNSQENLTTESSRKLKTHSSVNNVITIEQSLFYKRHNQCSLCGNELFIHIQKESASIIVKEKVSCLNCNVTISTSDHSMS